MFRASPSFRRPLFDSSNLSLSHLAVARRTFKLGARSTPVVLQRSHALPPTCLSPIPADARNGCVSIIVSYRALMGKNDTKEASLVKNDSVRKIGSKRYVIFSHGGIAPVFLPACALATLVPGTHLSCVGVNQLREAYTGQ